MRVRSAIAVALVAMLVLASCSDDKKTATSSSSSSNAPLTASFRGVKADSIKIGVATVDFECIKDFVDGTQGDDTKIINALVDDINANGGVLGRKLEVVAKSLCPLDPNSVTAACTAFTDDEQVFAVLGVYDPPPSDGGNQLCIARDKETILINELMVDSVIDEAPPGLALKPSIRASRGLEALLTLLKQDKTLDGKKMALLADQTNQAAAETAVKGAATDLGVTLGSTAVLTITNEDTSAAQAQLDSFIEKWKSEGVNTLMMSGLLVSAKQFVEKIKAAIPDMQLLSDTSDVAGQGQDETKAGKTPNPYEGLIALAGRTDSENFKLDAVQKCIDVYEKATGETVIGPDELKPDANGKSVRTYIGIWDRCNELSLLKQVAEKAGPNLTNDTFAAAVKSFGPIKLVTIDIGSLGDGKQDVNDGEALAHFDSSIGDGGDFKTDGPIQDVTAG